jgi:hypothetical protein
MVLHSTIVPQEFLVCAAAAQGNMPHTDALNCSCSKRHAQQQLERVRLRLSRFSFLSPPQRRQASLMSNNTSSITNI